MRWNPKRGRLSLSRKRLTVSTCLRSSDPPEADCCGSGTLYPTDPRNDRGRRRERETKARRERAELAGQRTERLAALEAQPQTVPVGKRTAEEALPKPEGEMRWALYVRLSASWLDEPAKSRVYLRLVR
jgi:hypothetical protein